jgi:hypothetical protein
VGYDSAALGWYASLRYADEGRTTAKHYHSFDREDTGLRKCEAWINGFVAEAGLPPLRFHTVRSRLISRISVRRGEGERPRD